MNRPELPLNPTWQQTIDYIFELGKYALIIEQENKLLRERAEKAEHALDHSDYHEGLDEGIAIGRAERDKLLQDQIDNSETNEDWIQALEEENERMTMLGNQLADAVEMSTSVNNWLADALMAWRER